MKNKIEKVIGGVVLFFFIVCTVYLIVSIQGFGIIPSKYITFIYVIMILLLILSITLITRKNMAVYLIGIISTLIISSGYLLATSYINKANHAINQMVNNKVTSVNYYVLVKKDSSIQNISELKDKRVGYIQDNNSLKLQNLLFSKVKCTATVYIDYNTILNDFFQDVPIILNSGYVEALGDEIPDFSDTYKIIYTFTVEEELDLDHEYIDITSEPILVYLSGMDTYGEISTRSRSDVNILMAINPKTHRILLVNTPRDYYVQLHGTTGLKDKLTHAGIYGIEKSMQTIEDLYGAKIDHYVRVNFNTLIKLIDEIGGIDIQSDTEFTAWTNKDVHVVKGLNHFNGEQALAYARERYSYATGDRHRGENQQQVITEIIKKVSNTKTLLSKYDAILDTLSNSFETDFSHNELKSFAKMQLNQNIKWDIESISVDGVGANQYTYSMGTKQLLYVMVPNQSTVDFAKSKLELILNEQ